MSKRTYKFNNAEDMVALAKEVSVHVYWNSYFKRSDESEEAGVYRFKDFWDHVESEINQPVKAIGVIIESNNGDPIVTFIYE